MNLSELSPAKGSKRDKKRVGRGPGSGLGKTAGRGHNGQKSRSGYSRRPGFEGGQMPLVRRVPKRGFTNVFRTEYAVVNLGDLADLVEAAGEITPDVLAEHGIVRRGRPIKVLGDGDATSEMKIKAHKFSASAREKIEQAGGTWEEI